MVKTRAAVNAVINEGLEVAAGAGTAAAKGGSVAEGASETEPGDVVPAVTNTVSEQGAENLQKATELSADKT